MIIGSDAKFQKSAHLRDPLMDIKVSRPDVSEVVEGQFWYNSASGQKRIEFKDNSVIVLVPRLDYSETITGTWAFQPSSGAPFTTNSTTVVTNLNADRVDGYHAAETATASTLVARDANGRAYVADPDTGNNESIINYGFLVGYVAGIRDPKDACRVATTANLAATRTSNVLTADANGSINTAGIDGQTDLAVNQRVLVKNQTTGADNGIYIITDLGSAGTKWVMQRASDADVSAEVTNGLQVWVTKGTENAGTGWLLNTPDPITLNTTALTFIQVNGTADIAQGNGIVIVGNTIHFAQSSTYTQGGLFYAATTTTVGHAQLTGILKGNGTSAPTALTSAANRVTYWTDANTIGGDANLTWASGVISATGGPYVFTGVAGTGTNPIATKLTNTGGDIYFGMDNSTGGNFDTGIAYAGVVWRSGNNPICFVTNSTLRWQVTGAGILRANGAQTIDASNTLTFATTANNGNIVLSPNGTGRVEIQNGNPTLHLYENDTSVDYKRWQFKTTGGNLFGTVLNDAESVSTNWLQVNRTTTTIDSITLSGTVVNLSYLTQNSVLFAGASGAVSQDNSNFQYNASYVSFTVGAAPAADRLVQFSRSGARTATDYGLIVDNGSTSSTASIAKMALRVLSTGTWNGASAVNYGVFIESISGGTTNWALYNNTAADCYLGSGNTLIGAAGTPLHLLHARASSVGGNITFLVENSDNTNSASGARSSCYVAGASAGDPRFILGVTAIKEWSMGIDNSDSDKFKIGEDSVVGSNTRFTIAVGGNVGINTTSPQVKLDVVGTIYAGNSSTYNVEMGADASNAYVRSNAVSTAFLIATRSAIPLIFQINDSEKFRIDTTGNIGINTTAPTATLDLAAAARSGASGLTNGWFQSRAATYTDNATAGSGTATQFAFHSIFQPTLAATNASVTTTDAATWYIAGAPANGTNMTLTRAWALWVDAGNVRLDGGLALGGETVTASGVINVSTGFRITNAATSGNYLRGDGTNFVSSAIQAADLPGSFAGFANPTASVGLTAVNGSATTAMRSDAAPALSQAIAPTWTGLHTFNLGTTPSEVIVLDIAALVAAGTRDSHIIRLTGRSYDTGAHNVDWRYFVDVTSNAGASTFVFQSRIDAGSYTTRFAVSDGGVITTGTIASGQVTNSHFVTSVSGTANRITSTGGLTPVIDISGSYVGQASITTLGTITSGTWNASIVGANYGGTGINVYAVNDLIYASGTTTLARLGTTADRVLITNGSGVPTWSLGLPAGITIGGKEAALIIDGTVTGDGSATTLTYNHALGKKARIVAVRKQSSNEVVLVDWKPTSGQTTTHVDIDFVNYTPANGEVFEVSVAA